MSTEPLFLPAVRLLLLDSLFRFRPEGEKLALGFGDSLRLS